MIFDKNQTEFKDCIQERTWELGTRQLPLEMTLPFVPDELKSACIDWYDFNKNLFADMYENPDRFGLEYDPFLSIHLNREKVVFYHWMLYFFRKDKFFTDNHYEMPAVVFRKRTKGINPKSLAALKERHGFVFEDIGGLIVVYNRLYPGMLAGAKQIDDAGFANYNVNCDDFRMYCDFRGLANYKRTYEDLHFVLSDKNRQIAEKMHNYSICKKITPQKCNFYFRVDYKFKGKIIYEIDLGEKNQFLINIGFAELGNESTEIIEKEREKYDDAVEYREFLLRNIKKCENCNPNCRSKNNPREILGKKRILCGGRFSIRICNPDDLDLKHIFRLLDFKKMAIEQN